MTILKNIKKHHLVVGAYPGGFGGQPLPLFVEKPTPKYFDIQKKSRFKETSQKNFLYMPHYSDIAEIKVIARNFSREGF